MAPKTDQNVVDGSHPGDTTLPATGPSTHLKSVALRTYGRPKPSEAPAGYPLWPLWYVAWAFLVTRRAGALFVVGLALDVLWPRHLT